MSKVISVGVESKEFSKRRPHDVQVLIFWLGALEFKILKFPLFSVHRSLKILEK